MAITIVSIVLHVAVVVLQLLTWVIVSHILHEFRRIRGLAEFIDDAEDMGYAHGRHGDNARAATEAEIEAEAETVFAGDVNFLQAVVSSAAAVDDDDVEEEDVAEAEKRRGEDRGFYF